MLETIPTLTPRTARRQAPRPPRIDPSPPPLQVALPSGAQATLPGEIWPQAAYQAHNDRSRLGDNRPPLLSVVQINKREVGDLLIEWGHPLHTPTPEHPSGRPFKRPFCFDGFALVAFGQPAAVMVSADPINRTVDRDLGLHRRNTVELARICRAPDQRHQRCLQAALRLYREYLAVLFDRYWGEGAIAAISTYSLPGKAGETYRSAGFRRVRGTRPSSGGGTWSRASQAADVGEAGDEMGLWVYRIPGRNPQPDTDTDGAPAQLQLAA
jgi:hypothetical protein